MRVADMAALLRGDEPGGNAARWNFPDAIGTSITAPGGIGDAATVGFSFMQALPDYDGPADHPGFLAFDAALQAAARQALGAWAAVCDLDFVEVPDAGEGGAIRFGRSDMALGGFTWFPDYAYALDADGRIAALQPYARGGDVWLSTAAALDAQAESGYGHYALVHEIGHAIGLKHPFEGSNTLPAAEDTLAQTIMAYALAGQLRRGDGDEDAGLLPMDRGQPLPLGADADRHRRGAIPLWPEPRDQCRRHAVCLGAGRALPADHRGTPAGPTRSMPATRRCPASST